MIPQFDEAELLQRIRQDDRGAFTLLYKKYLPGIYKYVFLISKSKTTSEEIAQDVFIKIWERRKKLENITSFKAYIFRSAKNLLLDQIKREKTAIKILKIIQPSTEESYETADLALNYRECQQMTTEAYALLPPKRKQIVELRTFDELSLDEIAVKLNISKGVVKKQLYSGLNFVKKYINNHIDIAVILMLIKILFI